MTESSLHSAIKDWYTVSGDELEVQVEDFIVDIRRGTLLIEIQTRNFAALKQKLKQLLLNHPVRLVYPIPQRKWIVHVSRAGQRMRRRKSPKTGRVMDLFYELVHTPRLIGEKRCSLEVLLIEEEEIRCADGRGSWRRRGVSVQDRKLIQVLERVMFEETRDFLTFLPKELEEVFTNKGLAVTLGISIRLAQKITYCLRQMGAISIAGKNGNELLYRISEN